jgi:general secretion pathway protein D
VPGRSVVPVITAICGLLWTGLVVAQSSATESSTPADAGIPIQQLVTIIAKKTGKKFVLDPRVRGNLQLIGEAPTEISYPEFLSALAANGYGAVEDAKLVILVPDVSLRQYPTPIITSKDTRLPYEYVTELIAVKNASAPQLIPILRPMVAQYGHMAALPGINTILLSDRFANVRRIEALIHAVDVPETAKPRSNRETNPADAGADH